jgi:hypothetical protein
VHLKEGAVVVVEEGTPQERKETNKRKHRARKKMLQAQLSKENKGHILLGYLGRTALRREQCDMMAESHNSGGKPGTHC